MSRHLVDIRDLRVEARNESGATTEIVHGIDLTVDRGEIVAMIGESGSGKTTIALSLLGYTRPGCRFTGGSILFDGVELLGMSEAKCAAFRGRDVAYVPQSAAAAFNPARTIMDQVIETARIHRLMPPAAARARALELFRALGLPQPETIGARYPHQVSGGQLQRLAAAMALIGAPKLLIFDEPTTALDVTTQIEVLRAFKAVIKQHGISGVYVSHDLAVVAQIASRIVVLRHGAVQEVGSTRQIISAPKHPYTRELLAAFSIHADGAQAKPAPAAEPAPLLELQNVVAGYGQIQADGMPMLTAVKSVSLKLAQGQNLGVIGESGSGKSTLAKVIAGLLPPVSGEVRLGGVPLPPQAHRRSRVQLRDMQIVFQSADTALNPAKSIADILGRPLTFYHGIRGRAREARVDALLDMVHLPRAMKSRRPGELSGGQKQRVNFARALAADPKLILCDEITSALDAVVGAAIVNLLKELQGELGVSYLFISHDMAMVRAICDEIVVMQQGEKIEQTSAAALGGPGSQPYSRLLCASTPQLDPDWLDEVTADRALMEAVANR